jgi:hypothetical protein
MQDDVLFASLTVYQTLLYTAKLRLGNLTAEEQIQKARHLSFFNLLLLSLLSLDLSDFCISRC